MQYLFDEQGVLARAGLNLHAVFALEALPADVRDALMGAGMEASRFHQLILLGHGGTALWQAVGADGLGVDDPIDSHSRKAAAAYLDASPACAGYAFLYPPSDNPVPLIRMGELAGWHHTSKFRVGINRDWGSWFAYRALVLADSRFTPVSRPRDTSPCDACEDKPCIKACPAAAVTDGEFLSGRCFDHRLSDGSSCAEACQARLACPVAAEHRYEADQVRYHYSRSLESLRSYRKRGLV
ncbi:MULTISPECIES: hypothetical protein [Kordiimonas]|uniref:hypothetical protein n=1 Tax=Kordiimonas TaxID=288021 RepID=UPI00257D1F12|nr:hypothetical protein [Kordiimonas sp. UBA4487]